MDGFLMDESMFRQVIMDHYNYPQNKVSDNLDGYIKLEGFTQTASGEVRDALTSLKSQNIQQLILDLR